MKVGAWVFAGFRFSARRRFASHEAKVGYLIPHWRAKADAMRLLESKASSTSCLYSLLWRVRSVRSDLMMGPAVS